MKKLILFAILIYGVSCKSPSDRATGNEDTGEKVLNTPANSMDDQPGSQEYDTSAAPAVSSKNANSATTGTNRAYGAAADSTKP